MNTITNAFKTAGVKLPPLNKRTWLWLKDHPGRTAKEIANAIGAKQGDVASTLGNMAKRKMVAATPDHRIARRQTLRYTSTIKEWELLPLPFVAKAPKVASPQLSLIPAAVMAPAPVPTAPPLSKPVLAVLEGYTLRELRAIRAALNHLFEYV